MGVKKDEFFRLLSKLLRIEVFLMENSSSLILEISSDEEVGFGDTGKGSGCGAGAGEFGDRDDFDWLSELLVDNLDDVVLVSETFPNPYKKTRLTANVVGDDEDDDCVVLDGDPDNPVLAPAIGNIDNGGDVEIVGEKGEVACRDFPHARHLCAKYLFASTRHDVHCNQCHCYVCDSLAPCSYWGTGIFSIDHCHATHKDECWRAERKHMKRVVNPVPAVPPINNNNPLLRPLFKPIQVPASPRPTVMSPNVTGPSASNRVRAQSVQVACRDFPHARHLCAKYLFASTRHGFHCNQGDSLAPCSYWGTGFSGNDHCHATDKDKYWRAERKHMKSVVNPVPAVPPINNNNPLRPLCKPTQAPASPRPTVTPFFSPCP
ncbi:hypothetical protein OROGR_025110 [Orobanche gracilis]